MVVANTVYNHNASAGDVACGQQQLSAAAFASACGVDVGTSTAKLPSLNTIAVWVREWLSVKQAL